MKTQIEDPIEDALRTYPLADVPTDLSSKIMEQIRAKSVRRIVVSPKVPFRLTWIDLALAFFLTLIPITGLVIWATLPRLALLHLTLEWQLIQDSGFLPILSVSLVIAGVLMLIAFVISLDQMFSSKASFR